MIPDIPLRGILAAYSPHNQEESPHFLRAIWRLFTALVPLFDAENTNYAFHFH
jgi:hypothetical protein